MSEVDASIHQLIQYNRSIHQSVANGDGRPESMDELTQALHQYQLHSKQCHNTVQPALHTINTSYHHINTVIHSDLIHTQQQIQLIHHQLYNTTDGVLRQHQQLQLQLNDIINQSKNITQITQLCQLFLSMYHTIQPIQVDHMNDVEKYSHTISVAINQLQYVKQQFPSIEYTALYQYFMNTVDTYKRDIIKYIGLNMDRYISIELSNCIDLTITQHHTGTLIDSLYKLQSTDVLIDTLYHTVSQYVKQLCWNEAIDCAVLSCNYTVQANLFHITNTTVEYNVLDVIIELLQYISSHIFTEHNQLFDELYRRVLCDISGCVIYNLTHNIPNDINKLESYRTEYIPMIQQFQSQLYSYHSHQTSPSCPFNEYCDQINYRFMDRLEYYTYEHLKQLIIDNNYELYSRVYHHTPYFTTVVDNNQWMNWLHPPINQLLTENTMKYSVTVIQIIHLLYESVSYYMYCSTKLHITDKISRLQQFIQYYIQLYIQLYESYYRLQLNTILYMNLLYINDNKLLIQYLLQLHKLLLLLTAPDNCNNDHKVNYIDTIHILRYHTDQQYKLQVESNKSNIEQLLHTIDLYAQQPSIDTINQLMFQLNQLHRHYTQLCIEFTTEMTLIIELICSYIVEQIVQMDDITVDHNVILDIIMEHIINKLSDYNGTVNLHTLHHYTRLYQLHQFVHPDQNLRSLRHELQNNQYNKLLTHEIKHLLMSLYESSDKRIELINYVEYR